MTREEQRNRHPDRRKGGAPAGYLRHRVFFADTRDAVHVGHRPCAARVPCAYGRWSSSMGSAHEPTDSEGTRSIQRSIPPVANRMTASTLPDASPTGADHRPTPKEQERP
jgi:hypothetical protein